MAVISYVHFNCDYNWTYLQMIQRSELIDLIKSAKIKCSTKQLETFCFKQVSRCTSIDVLYGASTMVK
jgi:hypothetical protein